MKAAIGVVVALVLIVAGALMPSPATMIAGNVEAARASSASIGCAIPAGTDVTMPDMSAEQVNAAQAIWRAAAETGMGDRAAVVGIATAMQESNLDTNVAATNGGLDVGTFQQRSLPGWYGPHATQAANVEWLSDPHNAATVFFTGRDENGIPGLDDIPGWETMPLTEAAQKVQRSAYPDAYAPHEAPATALVASFNGEAGPNPVLCDPPGAVDAANCPDSGLAVENGLTPDAVRVLRCAKAQFPGVLSWGGVRQDSLPYHPSGRAIDIMLPGRCDALGDQIAEWVRANAASMGVVDAIWCQKIWSVRRDAEGWRPMADRGSPTQNHMDHVHVTVAGNQAGTLEAAAGTAGGAVTPLASYTLTAWFNKPGPAWRSGFHTGQDFAAPAGTQIRSVAGGTVKSVGWNSAYGNLTTIDHGGGIVSYYAHQSATSVTAGQKIGAGQPIGKVGCTGNCFGDHLHFEIRKGGSLADPVAWLKSQGVNV